MIKQSFHNPPPIKNPMSHRLSRLALFVLLLFLAPAASAAIPGADDPDATTQHDRLRSELDYNRRTLIDVYEEAGRQDPAWDADAAALLEMAAVYFTYHDEEPVYLTGVDLPALAEMSAIAKRLTDVGCDDPLVLYCMGYALLMHDGHRLAHPPLEQAAEVMRDHGDAIPPMRRAKAYDRWSEHIHGNEEALAAYARLMREAYHDAVTWPDYEPADRPIVVGFINHWLDDESIADREAFVAGVEADQASDPWMRLMLRGEHEYDTAWEKRGGGFAGEVKPEGWMGFEEHLTRARAALVDAYELEPGYPDAAARLIRVAMGGAAEGPEGERYWFDRACEAQIDHEPAFDALFWALRPRWGGSHEQMLALGREALATERWDTIVPRFYMDALLDIASDDDDDASLWAEPAVFDGIQRYFTGVLDHPEWNHDAARERSQYVAAAVRAERVGVAREQVEELDGRVDPKAWAEMGLVGDVAPGLRLSRVYLETAGVGPAVEGARGLGEAGRHDDAAEAYRQIAAGLPPGDRALPAARYAAMSHELSAAVATGEEITLIGPGRLDGWNAWGGTWHEEDDGRFTGTSQRRNYRQGLLISTPQVLPQRLAITGRIDMQSGPLAVATAFVMLDFRLNSNDYGLFSAVGFCRGNTTHDPHVQLADYFDKKQKNVDTDLPDQFDFTLEWWEDRVHVEIDGEVVVDDHELPGFRERELVGLGIGSSASALDKSVRFDALTVRVLNEKPAWYGTAAAE